MLSLKTTRADECLLRSWYCCFNHAKVCIRISFCIQTSCKTLNGIKRSSSIDTCVIGEFNEPLRNQSGKYSYTCVFVKCIAFNEFLSLLDVERDNCGLTRWKVVSYIMLADLCWPVFVQQDLLYENHKCPCVASAKCFMSKDRNLRFFIWEHEDGNVLSYML